VSKNNKQVINESEKEKIVEELKNDLMELNKLKEIK
jgi:hypothetical protein